jgi:hypothetical protein
MFEVIITECECSPTEWEWQVCDASGRPLMVGWQKSPAEWSQQFEALGLNPR